MSQSVVPTYPKSQSHGKYISQNGPSGPKVFDDGKGISQMTGAYPKNDLYMSQNGKLWASHIPTVPKLWDKSVPVLGIFLINKSLSY